MDYIAAKQDLVGFTFLGLQIFFVCGFCSFVTTVLMGQQSYIPIYQLSLISCRFYVYLCRFSKLNKTETLIKHSILHKLINKMKQV